MERKDLLGMTIEELKAVCRGTGRSSVPRQTIVSMDPQRRT